MKKTLETWPKALLLWFESQQRDLPWRQHYALYEVWLSEIMLQQTKMETVLPYFRRFLQRFPTVHHLAEAPLEEVLHYWEGLGYYRRARHLHASAKIIAKKGFPQTKEGWLALPGIGDYTASAICAIALEQDEIALDGNLERVGARIWDFEGLPDKKKLKTAFSEALPKGKARYFNQALMELGALICNKKAPQCEACPLQKNCLAFERGTVLERPLAKKRPATVHEKVVLGILVDEQGRCFLQKRAEHQSLAGLWEFPGGKVETDESQEKALQRELQEEIQFQANSMHFLGEVKQFFTHHQRTLYAYIIPIQSEKVSLTTELDSAWVELENLEQFPMPKANRSLVNLLKKCYNV